jgi:hypothetical protein
MGVLEFLYTWWSQRRGVREKNLGWRIDYVLASPAAMRWVRAAFLQPQVTGSDHCPVGVDLEAGVLELDFTTSKIDDESSTAHEVESEDPVDGRAGRQRVAEDAEVESLAAECFDPLERQLRDELHSAAGRDLDTGGDAGGIIAGQDDEIPVDQRRGRTRVEREAGDDVAVWAPDSSRDDDQPALRVERNAHSTTAASSGSVPV